MNKNKRPQSPKSRSIMTRDMLLTMPSARVPSANAYKRRPKHILKGYDND